MGDFSKQMKKSVRLYITGTVQGVFFRAFIKENAERYNVKGFVRNLDDGRVEVFLEGDSDKVNKMMEICRKGPKHSMIRKVEEKPERFQDFKTFKLLHI
jgi:acylphosphatase